MADISGDPIPPVLSGASAGVLAQTHICTTSVAPADAPIPGAWLSVFGGGADSPLAARSDLARTASPAGPRRMRAPHPHGSGDSGIVPLITPMRQIATRFQVQEPEAQMPCFTQGARIDTMNGPVAVERIVPGDMVLTRDNGFCAVLWVARRNLEKPELMAQPELRPVRFRAGSLGNGLPLHDIAVSPRHRMLLMGGRAELLFGETEVLAAAAHLTGCDGVARVWQDQVTYLHLMFAQHQVIRANGAWTESFLPSAGTLRMLPTDQAREFHAIFPEFRNPAGYGAAKSARKCVVQHEVDLLLCR